MNEIERKSGTISVAKAAGAMLGRRVSPGTSVRVARGHCDIHGEYQAYIINDSSLRCPSCVLDDQRIIDDLENEKIREKTGQVTYWVAGQCVHEPPPRYINSTFDNYRVTCEGQQDILEGLKNYADAYSRTENTVSRNMIVTGRVGTGKTHLAIAMLRRMAERGLRGAYLTIFDLMRPDSKSPFSAQQGGVIDKLSSYDMVVLDELGAHPDFGFSSDLVASTLFQLIDNRYMLCKGTAIITNVDFEDLKTSKAGLGDRAMDRLQDAIGFTCYWESSR